MTDFQKKLLNRLLDKHQGGEAGFEEGKIKRKIRLDSQKEPIFKNYWAEDAYLYRDDIDKDVHDLQSQGLILAIFDKRNELLKEVVLNQSKEALDKAYELTKHVRKKNILLNEEIRIKELLSNSIEGKTDWNYLRYLLRLEKSHKSHLAFFKKIEDLDLQIRIIRAIESQDEEILLRNFSARKIHDSKIVEENKEKILSLFNRFSGDYYESIDKLYLTHHIVKNHGYAYIKNGLIFDINEQRIDLDKLGIDFSLSDDGINKMKILSCSKKKVITIENLTTFYYYKNNEAVIIYLGGYHNFTKRNLIEKIRDFNPNLCFYHIGDIDWGGFNVLMDLRRKTKINFSPLNMGIKELHKHRSELKNLTPSDRRKLKEMLVNPEAKDFVDIINEILKMDKKLEQEVLVFQEDKKNRY